MVNRKWFVAGFIVNAEGKIIHYFSRVSTHQSFSANPEVTLAIEKRIIEKDHKYKGDVVITSFNRV